MDSYYIFPYGQPDQNGCVVLYECLYNYVATIKTKIKSNATFLNLGKIREIFKKRKRRGKSQSSYGEMLKR